MKPKTLPIPNEIRESNKFRDKEMEVRGLPMTPGFELRALEEGSFEGYIAVWGTIDSYRSTFQRGAFTKTIKDRGTRIKVLYDHDQVIGKVVEIREDDKGVFVRGKLTMDLEKARDTHALMLDAVIDTLSFGFSVVDQKYDNGVRTITEVKLFEVSPVVFEANENAVVTDVRSHEPNPFPAPDEQRGIQESVDFVEMHRRRRLLVETLDEQLTDEFYYTNGFDLFAQNSEQLIDEFKSLYMQWMADFTAHYEEQSARAVADGNALSIALRQHYIAKNITPETVAINTSLSLQEVRDLTAGRLITAVYKLAELPPEIRDAHQQIKRKAVETLCDEIRTAMTDADKQRITSLLFKEAGSTETNEVRSAIGFLKTLQLELGEQQ